MFEFFILFKDLNVLEIKGQKLTSLFFYCQLHLCTAIKLLLFITATLYKNTAKNIFLL